MIFGLGLLLSGTVGFVGWCIAAVLKTQPGAVSGIFACFSAPEDWLVLLFFAGLAAAGLWIACTGYKKSRTGEPGEN